MTTGPIPLSDTPARCPDGCEHPLTVHSADRGCCLCDCVHGRRSGAAGSSGEDGGAIRSEAERRAAWRPGDDLSSVECRMLEMAEAGEPFDPGEGSERTIRAGVLRHLLVDTEWDVQPKGVQICGVQILGNLDLESANVRCPLRLEKCHLYGVILNYATVSLVEITHCQLASLAGHALVVTRDLNLDHSMSTERFWLLGADIAGQLLCREATLTGTENYALVADGMKVGGDVFFDGLTTNGVVSLVGANITGQLSCKGADLSGVVQALIADEIKVGGSVYLDAYDAGDNQVTPFKADGAVSLVGADIFGQLTCASAQLTAPRGGHAHSLTANGIKVRGDVRLDEGFIADGKVSLRSARVGGSLRVAPDELATAPDHVAIDATGAQADELVFRPSKPIGGQVILKDAVVGLLDWHQASASDTVRIRRPEAGVPFTVRQPDAHEPPSPSGTVVLDGLTYTGFGEGLATFDQRLEWIQSQHGFAAQPYQQLAKFYREAGQDTEARKVAVQRRRDLRRRGGLKWYRKLGNLLLDFTIQYGYQTWRAVVGVALLYVIVVAFFWFARYHNAVIPTQTTPGLGKVPAVPTARSCTSDYPCFSPFGYAINTVIPLINVHQADFWGPNARVSWGRVGVVVTYLGTLFGWLLATLAVAGYTGLARKYDDP